MTIRQISLGFTVAMLVATTSAAATAPVMPSAGNLCVPAAGNDLAGARIGALKSKRSSAIAPLLTLLGVVALAGTVGGAAAIAAHSDNSSTSP